jgi:four helix bundle protein
MGDFKELIVWRRAVDVARGVYCTTRTFPRNELFGLTAQARRAAISISSNIAEGAGRGSSSPDQARFYRMAMGSARELESLLIVATEIDLLTSKDRDSICSLVSEVQRMLAGLIRSSRES